ncbi:MAG TPA: enoyl-CoA hydratase-related protein [Candidatus Obscuribacterales bacterium]
MNTVEASRQVLLTKKDSGIAIVLLDGSGKLNSLGTPVMRELQQIIRTIGSDPQIKAAIVISGKPDNFVIGADLFEIRKVTVEEDLHNLSRNGQQTLNDTANLSKPLVVAINGTCLGGGLELALAGHWRIASDEPITQLGLPETRLGIIPGLGGTQRLPRLVGLKQALGMILSAEAISAQEALGVGLVDELVPSSELMSRAEKRALELAANPAVFVERQALMGTLVEQTAWPLKDVDEEKANKLFAMTERSIRIKTKGNYPAQMRVLDVIKTGLTKGIKAGLEAESRLFSELAFSETSANLIALFFQTDFAKQSARSLGAKFGQNNTCKVGIIGGGMMGGSIARLSSQQGMTAVVKVKTGKTAEASQHIQGPHIQCVEDWAKLSDCQLVLECVPEDVALKHSVLKQIESVVSPDCTIASNTSALSLAELARGLDKNDRFVGLHFFHPVDRMPLVEIISLKTTSRKAAARAADFVTKLGKIPLMVKDGPGFLINRLLSCYLLAAANLMEEGVPLNWIDEAAIDFGLPMGPCELLDEVGLDLGYKVAANLHQTLGERMRPSDILKNIPKLGLVGKKNGKGIYLYDETGRRKEFNPEVAAIPNVKTSTEKADDATKKKIVQRLVMPMIDEAARCLEDRIIMKPREVDMAIVYGIGFPPFRGGLLKYADHVGLPEVVNQLNDNDRCTSPKRGVAPLISKYVAEGRGFYSRGGKEEE